MGMYAILEIVSGSHEGKKLEVRPGQTLTVGRHDQANLVIREDAMMSNVHFALECDGENCRIRDLKSRFGTQVNQMRVTEAVIHDSDRIVAGSTTFVVRISGEATTSEAAAHPEVPASVKMDMTAKPAQEQLSMKAVGELDKIHNRVLQELRQQREPLYALLDGARDPLVLARLVSSEEEYQSLYEGPKGEAMAAFGPYLVKLPKESPFLKTLVHEGWGKSWGIYLTCAQSFQEVRKHFRHFLKVEFPDGEEVYFRFYDPRVLRVFLPTCTAQEALQFFGPISNFFVESQNSDRWIRFTASLRGIGHNSPAVFVPVQEEALKLA